MEPGSSNDRSNSASTGPLDTVGRLVGFLLFAAPAMSIIAALVLLPAYKHYALTQYELACLKTSVEEADQWISANRRLIKDLPDDEVLNTRLILGQSTLAPANEIIVKDPDNPPRPPVMVSPQKHARPAPPQGVLMKYADKIENPRIQRGLFLLAGGALLAALFLFSPSSRRKED